MENKAHALAAGVFVVVVTAMLLALAAWLMRDTGERDIYEISTRETVTGLQAQAPVRYRGVDVGKVAAIGFDPRTQGNVLMRLEVDRQAPLSQDTFATLGFQGVTGLAFVQLDDAGKPAPRLVPNDASPPRIPLRPGLLSKLTVKGEAILDQVEQVSVRLNQLLAGANQQRIASALDQVGQAATSVGQAATSVQQLGARLTAAVDTQLAPDKLNIPRLVQTAQGTLEAVRGTSEQAGAMATEIGKTARRLNEKDGPVDRLAEGAQALAHAADGFNAATLPRVNRVTEDTSRAVRQLGRTVNNINDNPQSLIFGTGRIDPGPGEPGFQSERGGR